MTTGYNYLVSDDTDDIDWLPPVYTFLNYPCTKPDKHRVAYVLFQRAGCLMAHQ